MWEAQSSNLRYGTGDFELDSSRLISSISGQYLDITCNGLVPLIHEATLQAYSN